MITEWEMAEGALNRFSLSPPVSPTSADSPRPHHQSAKVGPRLKTKKPSTPTSRIVSNCLKKTRTWLGMRLGSMGVIWEMRGPWWIRVGNLRRLCSLIMSVEPGREKGELTCFLSARFHVLPSLLPPSLYPALLRFNVDA